MSRKAKDQVCFSVQYFCVVFLCGISELSNLISFLPLKMHLVIGDTEIASAVVSSSTDTLEERAISLMPFFLERRVNIRLESGQDKPSVCAAILWCID